MMELARPHQHVWPHWPMWVLCWRQHDMPKLQGQGRCVRVTLRVTLDVVWLCDFSLMSSKQLGSGELPGLWQ